MVSLLYYNTLVVRDRHMLLLEQAIFDHCILDDFQAVSEDVGRMRHLDSEAAEHIQDSNRRALGGGRWHRTTVVTQTNASTDNKRRI